MVTAARNEEIIAALDVGSSKVSAIIARIKPGSQIEVLGTGQRESKGVSRGYVADMAATETAIRVAVDQAERIAKTSVENVWVSFSSGGLFADKASVEIDLGGYKIEQSDIDALLNTARQSINPDGRLVLHATPAAYSIDGLEGVRNPVGLHADRLAVDVHVVTADPSPVRNLDTSVRKAHLNVRKIVAAPIATGMACLSEDERQVGVALIEFGAGITNVSVYQKGMLVNLASIQMGSADITDDIATAFGAKRAQAERLKCVMGAATISPRDNHEMIDITPISGEDDGLEPPRITRAQLIGVIRQRLETWMGAVAKELDTFSAHGPVVRQVVLTGGGAELKGIADYAQGVLGRSVRVGRPRGMLGLPDAHSGPAFSTMAGLVQYAGADPYDLRDGELGGQLVHRPLSSSFINRLISAFKKSY